MLRSCVRRLVVAISFAPPWLVANLRNTWSSWHGFTLYGLSAVRGPGSRSNRPGREEFKKSKTSFVSSDVGGEGCCEKGNTSRACSGGPVGMHVAPCLICAPIAPIWGTVAGRLGKVLCSEGGLGERCCGWQLHLFFFFCGCYDRCWIDDMKHDLLDSSIARGCRRCGCSSVCAQLQVLSVAFASSSSGLLVGAGMYVTNHPPHVLLLDAVKVLQRLAAPLSATAALAFHHILSSVSGLRVDN